MICASICRRQWLNTARFDEVVKKNSGGCCWKLTNENKKAIVFFMKLQEHNLFSEEKRRFQRVRTRVQYEVLGGEPSEEITYTEDISAGGMCVITRVQLNVDTLLLFSLGLPGGGLVQTKGRVVREREVSVTWSIRPCYESAIEFIDITSETRARLSHYIVRYINQRS